MFNTIQEGIKFLKKQALESISSDSLYIPLQGKRTNFAAEPAFDLKEAIDRFLLPTDSQKVLLLQGDAGSGKSSFCKELVVQLWKQYQAGAVNSSNLVSSAAALASTPLSHPPTSLQQEMKGDSQAVSTQPPSSVVTAIPLFIMLPLLRDPLHHVIEETLDKHGFSEEQIATLKKEYRFIVVLDGYDELHQFQNLYVTNKLQAWQAKVIITCRSQALYYVSDYQRYFEPYEKNERQMLLLQQLYVAPFSSEQIEAYLKRYGAMQTEGASESSKPITREQLESIPGLKQLIKTPFLLHLAVEALPGILKEEQGKEVKEEKAGRGPTITQAKLYDVFIEQWFIRQEEKLKLKKLITDTEDPKPKFWHYSKTLAQRMNEEKISLVTYQPKKTSDLFAENAEVAQGNKTPNWDEFFSQESEVEKIRSGCPLQQYGVNQYGFIHASMIDYFTTRVMYEEFVAPPAKPAVSAVTTVPSELREDEKRSHQSVVTLSDSGGLKEAIHVKLLTHNPEKVLFLSDRVEESEAFKAKMFSIVEASKQDERYAIGAANAISVLNGANVSLSGMDLRGVRIPGADLSGALLDSTQLQGADLTGARLQSAWMREANLTGALLKDIRFSEWPMIILQGIVYCCAYSPDGRLLAITENNKKKMVYDIVLVDTSTRKTVRRLQGHTWQVRSVAFDARGERLASGSYDKSVRVWGVRSGQELRRLTGHTEEVNSVAFDARGERLASGSRDNSVRVWDVGSGKELRCLQGHTNTVNGVVFDARGERLASGSGDYHGKDNSVRVWDVGSGKELRCLQGHTSYVMSVAFDARGERLASGSLDNSVRVWDVASGQELRCLQGHTGNVYSVTFDARGERLASGSEDKSVRVWDVVSGQELRRLTGHTNTVYSVAFDARGERLASGSYDNSVRVWDVGSGQELRCMHGHTDWVNSVAFDARGERLASGGGDMKVRMWDVVSGQELRRFTGHTNVVNSVVFDARGERLASGSLDNSVRVWDVASGQELRCLQGHTAWVYSVAFDARGERLASGSDDKSVRVWDVVSGQELRRLTGHTGSVYSVAFDVRGERLASGSEDKSVRVWDVGSGQELHCLQGHTGWVRSVTFDVRGERLASGSESEDNSVRVWDVVSGQELRRLVGHTSVHSVAFDARGERLLVSRSWDKSVRVWDVTSGRELWCLDLPQTVSSCAWTTTAIGIELLAVAFVNSLACFELKRIQQTYHARLCWLNSSSVQLHLPGLKLDQAKELSEDNYALLQQRGAQGKPASIQQSASSVADEKQTTLPLAKSNEPLSPQPPQSTQKLQIDSDTKSYKDFLSELKLLHGIKVSKSSAAQDEKVTVRQDIAIGERLNSPLQKDERPLKRLLECYLVNYQQHRHENELTKLLQKYIFLLNPEISKHSTISGKGFSLFHPADVSGDRILYFLGKQYSSQGEFKESVASFIRSFINTIRQNDFWNGQSHAQVEYVNSLKLFRRADLSEVCKALTGSTNPGEKKEIKASYDLFLKDRQKRQDAIKRIGEIAHIETESSQSETSAKQQTATLKM